MARSFASGFQNGFSCAGQPDDFNGQRYFFGGEHHGGGMFFQAQRIAGRTYETMAVYIEVVIIYLIFSTILEYIQRRGEKKLGKYGSN